MSKTKNIISNLTSIKEKKRDVLESHLTIKNFREMSYYNRGYIKSFLPKYNQLINELQNENIIGKRSQISHDYDGFCEFYDSLAQVIELQRPTKGPLREHYSDLINHFNEKMKVILDKVNNIFNTPISFIFNPDRQLGDFVPIIKYTELAESFDGGTDIYLVFEINAFLSHKYGAYGRTYIYYSNFSFNINLISGVENIGLNHSSRKLEETDLKVLEATDPTSIKKRVSIKDFPSSDIDGQNIILTKFLRKLNRILLKFDEEELLYMDDGASYYSETVCRSNSKYPLGFIDQFFLEYYFVPELINRYNRYKIDNVKTIISKILNVSLAEEINELHSVTLEYIINVSPNVEIFFKVRFLEKAFRNEVPLIRFTVFPRHSLDYTIPITSALLKQDMADLRELEENWLWVK